VKRVLVIAAVGIETRGLARHLGLTRQSAVPGLRYRGAGFDLACVGPRALRLDRFEDLISNAGLVVSAGTCGALAPHLQEGDLVVPDTVLTLDGSRHRLPAVPGLQAGGAMLSLDRVVETSEGKARFWRDTGALAVDMESAAIVEWAETRGLRVVVIRGVSDTAERGVPAALAGTVDDDGRARVGRVIRAVVSEPRTVARALALRRGTAAALSRVAGALRVLAVPGVSGEYGVNDVACLPSVRVANRPSMRAADRPSRNEAPCPPSRTSGR
jgi:adenosylhomocysteine nucleosidase